MMNLCWLRRDLRLHDNAALSRSLNEGSTVLVFIFDSSILRKLPGKSDPRVGFIYESLKEMEVEVRKFGSSIIIRHGDPVDIIPELTRELGIRSVYCNRDYEPYAKKRDEEVKRRLEASSVNFHSFKDSVFFEKQEVQTVQKDYYRVFTPYKNKWIRHFEDMGRMIPDHTCDLKRLKKLLPSRSILEHDWYKEIGLLPSLPSLPAGTKAGLERLKAFEERIDDYKKNRDYPSRDGTSLLSTYIRHGNISIREMLRTGTSRSSEGARAWVSELIWREFYQMILDAFPEVENGPFKKQYQSIQWAGLSSHFKAWCDGKTGFPLVDAAMRCLNTTGRMHNRLRMVVASFLCKTLLINWQKGEKYFADRLLDFDLAANNGGWQWAASTGCDAQPYFRVFNPFTQSKRYDPEGDFIRKWVPELAHLSSPEIHRPSRENAPNYPRPIVSYELNRVRAVALYEAV